MEPSLGSLVEFLAPPFKNRASRVQSARSAGTYATSPHSRQRSAGGATASSNHRRPNANEVLKLDMTEYGISYVDNTTDGYCFVNSIKQAQERVKLQSQQQSRPVTRGLLTKSRPKTAVIKESKKASAPKMREETDALKPFETLENMVKNELQMRANHFLIRTMKKEQALVNQLGNAKKSTSDNIFLELANGMMNIHNGEIKPKTPDGLYKPTFNSVAIDDARQKCADTSIDL